MFMTEDKMNNSIDINTKTTFQQLSTQMESLLEQYKSQYPQKVSDIIRRRLGLIILILCVTIFVGGYLSLNFFTVVFAMCAAPGMALFSIVQLNAELRRKKDEHDYLSEINKLQEQMKPLAVYPDVKNYCYGFNRRLDQTAEYKAMIKDKFNRRFLFFIGVCAAVLLVIYSRFSLYEGDPFSDHNVVEDQIQKQSVVYIADQVQLDNNLVCTLTPLPQTDEFHNPQLRFYYSPTDLSMSTDITEITVPYADTRYIMLITDKDGKPVPRAPVFMFYVEEDVAVADFRTDGCLEIVRIIKFLNENQNNLFYNIEIVE